MSPATLLPGVRRLPLVLALRPALVGWGIGLLLRLQVVEPTAIIHACDLAPWQGWCAPRSLLLMTFATQGLGWLALAAGLAALLTRRRALAGLALAVGGAGLVLYCVELSAAGLLAGALALVRPPRPVGSRP